MDRADYLVLGAQGQLGGEFVRRLGARAKGLGRAEADLSIPGSAAKAVAQARPRVVLNCAAYTAVDRAEDEPASAERINAQAVGELAQACSEHGARLVHISTDYVFDAEEHASSPHTEIEVPVPRGTYARSKRAGEIAAGSQSLVVRTCGLYGRLIPGHGGNFVETMLRVGPQRGTVRVVNDQRCTPSYVSDVAAAVLWLVEREARGIFHVVNAGETTWFDFAQAIFRLASLPVTVEPITSAEYGAKAPRPVYSVLSTSKYESAGGPPLRPWEGALAAYLKSRN